MNRLIQLLLLWVLPLYAATAQELQIDRLKRQLASARQDTGRVLLMTQLCEAIRTRSPDSAKLFGERALKLANQINYPKGQIRATSYLGRVEVDLGNLPKALAMTYKALDMANTNSLNAEKEYIFSHIGTVYYSLQNYPMAISYVKKSLAVSYKYGIDSRIRSSHMNLALNLAETNNLDSAMYHAQRALTLSEQAKLRINPLIYRNIGIIYFKQKNFRKALTYWEMARQLAQPLGEYRTLAIVNFLSASVYRELHQRDSCLYFAKISLVNAQRITYGRGILDAAALLSELYEPTDARESLRYYKLAAAAKESLFGAGNIQAIQEMIAQEQVRQREVEQAKVDYQNQLRLYSLLAGVVGLLIIAFILYRNNRQKYRANQLLNEQKTKVEQTLETLRTTQTQLIQKEKMASLGELTAGIAHEIQNPLNFVNNFAEVSVELAEELAEEWKQGRTGAPDKRDEGVEADLLRDLRANMKTIAHNGQRASNIVRAMLEHSRTSSGERQPTSLNALAEEYLRLAYHGIRAKDNQFHCELITDFAADLPLVEVVPQDIGRVLLNLFNNAFYAVSQQAGSLVQGAWDEEETYQPVVWVSTAHANGHVQIRVRDNGTGIPDIIREKIFQPFFTTKPTGEGTGLGLSLSYDIVTKGHGGTLRVESEAGEGSEFVIELPIKAQSVW
ncbi:tetratricopeptide repeat-containing sensor histidine kinase [Spirosoma gilvum]